MKALWENLFKNWNRQESLTKTVLKQIPVFHELSDRQIHEIENLCHKRRYKQGETVFKRLAPGEGMFIILSGAIEIFTEDNNDNKKTLAILNNGEFFGELSLLDSDIRSATAMATENSDLLAFLRPDLQSFSKRNPQTGNKILFNLAKVMAARLRKTSEQVSEKSAELV